ncbi:c-type cytochrome [Flammeovirga yaeyamensis]|uniref:C-type cytochrome n=1 Tax=Flammeovirga yaeyamensis TaxID=367791 RepID=A0AAX1N5A9_9BACT|nr:c-type cytochrome [Flammeovirga yaeyamensis]MBB3697325.1 mono/diheme cytochrome c family protein [Flammeovirga yaeyamensis]NMF36019.1 c-type cytochrome [Flammeovirga yaeyamensis]QWG02754.1 c-type cytochrome [Flammeovirga yaeyamensis]
MSIGRSVLRLRSTLAVVCGLLLASTMVFGQGDGIPTDEAAISAGAELFDGNCSSCHQIHEKGIAPALKNVYERRDVKWLTKFIKHPGKTIESGDAYAVALYEEFKPTIMPNQDLTDEEILQVLAYVKDATIKGPAKPAAEAAAASTGAEAGTPQGMVVSSNLLVGVIIGLLVLLGIVLIVLVILANVLTQYLRQQKGLEAEDEAYINEKFSLAAIFKSQVFVGLASFAFVMIVAKVTIDSLFAVGVQQGYAPEQPINFSHKLHAGYYEIDCKYCHTGVEKSKNANIPSANICMNCHNSIRQNSPEIQKIYAAIENDQPIQWVRVHNLPDLAYFNHSQHVKVGGVECQTCHGEIEKMEVVQQHSLLTMGWCIDCHRQTDVNAKGNAYYDKMVEMHDATSKEPMKVKDIGGLECAKCHY